MSPSLKNTKAKEWKLIAQHIAKRLKDDEKKLLLHPEAAAPIRRCMADDQVRLRAAQDFVEMHSR